MPSAQILKYQAPYMTRKRDETKVSVIYEGLVYDMPKEIAENVKFTKATKGINSLHDIRYVAYEDIKEHLTNPRKGYWFNQGGWFSLEENGSEIDKPEDDDRSKIDKPEKSE